MKHSPILCLEDDEDDAFFLKTAFKNAHLTHPLTTVHDGQEAIEYLSGAGKYADRTRYPVPLLVLLDLKTPRKTGIEVLKWIRAHAEFHRMVVIMLTASASPADIAAAYAAGANAFVVKPSGIDKLTESIRAIHLFWFGQNRFPPEIAAS